MSRIAPLLCVAVFAAGCGGGGDEKKPPALQGTNDPAATKVAQAYVDAYTAKNPEAICRLLAESVRAELSKAKSCGRALRPTLKLDFPKFTALRSYKNGATAVVSFKDSPRQVTLTREAGAWRVSNGGT